MSNYKPPSSYMLQTRVVIPRPNIRLKTGPAMQPVKAISPKPFLAMVTLATTSPSELPQESTVRPSSEEGNPVMIPISSRIWTMISQLM